MNNPQPIQDNRGDCPRAKREGLSPNSNPQPIHEDEIDLREYINVLIKRKKLILGVFLAAILISVPMVSLQPPAYKANTLIMVTPSKIPAVLTPSKDSVDLERYDLGRYVTLQPSISLVAHEELLKSSVVLERTIKHLDLKDSLAHPLAPGILSKKIGVEKTKEANLLSLTVSDRDPKKAAEIANTWANEYVKYSQELILGEVKGTGDFVVSQFEIAKKSLLAIEEKINEFNKKYKLDLMKMAVDVKKRALGEHKNELVDIELKLKSKTDSLIELKKQIALQEKFIVVSKAITDDALWQLSAQGKGKAKSVEGSLKSEVINPVYQDLEQRIVNIDIEVNTLKPREEYLNKTISALESEAKSLENELIQRESESLQLRREKEIAERTYNNLSGKIEEARIIKEAQLGEVRIVSPAVAPTEPVGQNKKLKVILAGFMGLMAGVFFTFFKEFQRKT